MMPPQHWVYNDTAGTGRRIMLVAPEDFMPPEELECIEPYPQLYELSEEN